MTTLAEREREKEFRVSGVFLKRKLIKSDLGPTFLTLLFILQSLSCVCLFVTPQTEACQDSLIFTISQVCSKSCPLSWWCHPTISSSVIPFFSSPQSFPASGSFPSSWHFASGGWNIGASASASASVLPMNNLGWFSLGLTGLISLLSKGLSRVFSSTTVQKHHFFGSQPSLWPYLMLITLGKALTLNMGYNIWIFCNWEI